MKTQNTPPLSVCLEIARCFRSMHVPMAEQREFWRPQWTANSQYGYALEYCRTRKDALRHTLNYYAARMHLIRQ